MLNIEVNDGQWIFYDFDMEKFFDKESLLDTINVLYISGNSNE